MISTHSDISQIQQTEPFVSSFLGTTPITFEFTCSLQFQDNVSIHEDLKDDARKTVKPCR